MTVARTYSLWARHLVDFLLPPACAGCGGALPSRGTGQAPRICARCLSRLRAPAHPRCDRCHAPRGTGLAPDRPCLECLDWPAILVGARSAVVLASPADRLVHAFKYDGWPGLAQELSGRMGSLLAASGWTHPPAPMVPVPTTPGRLRARGYNQARLLAEALSRRTGHRLVDALVRRDRGGSQVALQPDQRRANVEGAFSMGPEAGPLVRGEDVILVDDVLTTGATAVSASLALGHGGAASVRLLTFARSLPGSE